MGIGNCLLSTATALAACLVQVLVAVPQVQAQSAAILTGHVSSTAEGAMEGVVVSAKKDGAAITVSVVTDK